MALRGECQGVRQRNRIDPHSRLGVASGDDRVEQRRIDQAAAPLGRPQARLDRAAKKRRRRDLGSRVLVECGQLAVGAKTREGSLEFGDEHPGPLRRIAGGGRTGQGLADEHPDLAAHRVEGDVVQGHDDEVVTGAGAATDPEDE